ncbi:MAG TPA: CbtA family protein, partial [Mycobacterium sp.]|nr:CbtA family protein [Mycobacterium sp.]
IRQRTLLYLLMVVLSAALLVAAVYLGHRLTAQYGQWSATLIAAATYLVAIAVVMLVLPTIDETPADFSADVLYEFRLYSLGTQLVMWAVIGLVFASTVGRLLGERKGELVGSQGAGAVGAPPARRAGGRLGGI